MKYDFFVYQLDILNLGEICMVVTSAEIQILIPCIFWLSPKLGIKKIENKIVILKGETFMTSKTVKVRFDAYSIGLICGIQCEILWGGAVQVDLYIFNLTISSYCSWSFWYLLDSDTQVGLTNLCCIRNVFLMIRKKLSFVTLTACTFFQYYA